MSKLLVRVDYIVAKTVINGLRNWLLKLEELLDRAAEEKAIEENEENRKGK